MEPETKMKLGGISGILSGILSIIFPFTLNLIQKIQFTEDVISFASQSFSVFTITGLLSIFTGVFYFLFGVGFLGGGKKFEKVFGGLKRRISIVIGIVAFLLCISYIILGASLLNLAYLFQVIVAGTIYKSSDEAIRALMHGLSGTLVGILLIIAFSFILSVFAMVYFFELPKGELGVIGGAFSFLGFIVGIVVSTGWILNSVGTILMGICLFLQSSTQ